MARKHGFWRRVPTGFPVAAVSAGVSVPSWVPAGASGWADFVNGQYWDETNGETDFDTMFDFARTGAAYGDDATDAWTEYATGVHRLGDDWLFYEGAGSRLSTFPRTPFTNWSGSGAGKTIDATTYLGIFSNSCLVAANTPAVWNRIQTPNTGTFTMGTPYGFTAIYKAGTSGKVLINLRNQTAAAESIVAGTIGSVAVVGTSAGSVTGMVERALTGGFYMCSGIITPSANGAFALGIGPYTTSAENVLAVAGWFEATAPSSIILGTESSTDTRGAEELTIHLGDDTYDLTLTFDDDSTQEIASETGDYALVTALDRPRVTSIDWRGV